MKRTKLNKKSLEKNNEWFRKKCVELAKRIVRHKQGYICEYCGMVCEPNGKVSHGSHIYSEGSNHGMSADLDNILCLCYSHHMGGFNKKISWHNNPLEMAEWFMQKFPQRYQELKKRSQKPLKVDFKQKLEELKEEYFKLIN